MVPRAAAVAGVVRRGQEAGVAEAEVPRQAEAGVAVPAREAAVEAEVPAREAAEAAAGRRHRAAPAGAEAAAVGCRSGHSRR